MHAPRLEYKGHKWLAELLLTGLIRLDLELVLTHNWPLFTAIIMSQEAMDSSACPDILRK